MDTPKQGKILAVDDDPTSLTLIVKVLSTNPAWEVKGTRSAREAMELAPAFQPHLILSDYYMPETDGFEFCRAVKGDPRLASPLFILLTSETEVSKKVAGLEEGADDYMEKPFSADVLVSKVKALLRVKNLQDEVRREKEQLALANERLGKNLEEMTSLLLQILDSRIPGSRDRATLARSAAEFMAGRLQMGEEEGRNLRFAALLHEVGKVGLPDGIIAEDPRSRTAEDLQIFRQYPLIGSMLVSTISGFKRSAHDIHHQLENYDGTGSPMGLKGEEIPLGARILRALVLVDDLRRNGLATGMILQQIGSFAQKILDPKVASLLEEFLVENDEEFSADRRKVRLEDLQPGMVIAADVFTISGIKLLPQGFRLQERPLRLLLNHSQADPILGGVYVLCGEKLRVGS